MSTSVKRLELTGISRSTELLVPADVIRVAAFTSAAQELLALFAEWPALESLRLTAHCDVRGTDRPGRLLAKHTFKLIGIGAPVSLSGAEATAWALDHLPYETMASGTVELVRRDAVVQRYLELPSGADAARYGVISEVAARLASSFEHLALVHDFAGL